MRGQIKKTEYKMELAIAQYACMVDRMAQTRQFDEFLESIKDMLLEPMQQVWGSQVPEGFIATQALHDMPPGIFSNQSYKVYETIYFLPTFTIQQEMGGCSQNMKFDEGRKASKSLGCSWTEGKGKRKVDSFIVGDIYMQ